MSGFGGSVKLTGESEYRKALKQISLELKEVDSELKVVTSSYDKNDKSEEALSAQSDVLAKKLDAQAKKVEVLKDNYKAMQAQVEENRAKHEALKGTLDNAVKELERIEQESGKTSEEYKTQAEAVAGLSADYNQTSKAIDAQEQALSKARIEINKAQTDYNNTDKSLKGLTEAETETTKGSKELGKAVEDSGKQADKSAKGGFTVLKGALASLAGDALKSAVKGIKDGLLEISKASAQAVSDVINLGDSIDKNSAKLGISAEGYQTWSYVFSRSGADIEGFKSSFLKLTKAIEEGSDAFSELGISADDLNNLNKEEIFSKVISGLQNITDENKKTVLANKLLGKGAVELGSLLQQSNADTENLKTRVKELGGVMSTDGVKSAVAMQDSLTDMKTSLTGVKNNLVLQFLPSLQQVVDGITAIFAGGNIDEAFNNIAEGITKSADTIFNKVIPTIFNMIPPLLTKGLPVLISAIETVLSSLMSMLPQVLPVLFNGVEILVTDLCNWLATEGNVTELLNGVLDLVLMLTEQFGRLLPVIIPALVEVIAEIIGFITNPDNIGKLIEMTLYLIGAVAEALIKSIPAFINIFKNLGLNIVTLFVNFGKSIKDKATNLFNTVKNGVAEFVGGIRDKLISARDNLINGVKNIGIKIGEFVSSIFSKVAELPKKVLSIGSDLVLGLWNGIKSKMEYLKNKISEFGKNITNKIKSVFGIASPSKVTKKLGGYLAEGLGLGFTEEMKEVRADITDALPTFDMPANVSAGTSLQSTGGLDYYTMVNAFKEALSSMSVELDDRQIGSFVKKTVSNAIYN